MNKESFFDIIVSNLIICFSHCLIIFTWCYFFYNFSHKINFLLFYLPYGIIILAFLFFGNRIIFGLFFSHICLYLVVENFNLNLPFNNFFIISICQLICVPMTLFLFKIFNVTVGSNKSYKLNKTNILHVLLITFYSIILFGILINFSSLFFHNKTNLLMFTFGNLFGGVILLVFVKILANIPKAFRSFFANS